MPTEKGGGLCFRAPDSASGNCLRIAFIVEPRKPTLLSRRHCANTDSEAVRVGSHGHMVAEGLGSDQGSGCYSSDNIILYIIYKILHNTL